ncbi:amino acid adenylation domain-containing protein [Micromonospora sp. CA-248089]|uniref:amino acid adenylation domain-containing protein n=1 Tax=Micromonospora sp. CA-248089 TaxID=3239960 RepID=UPI003D8B6476
MATSMQVGLWLAQKLSPGVRNNIAGWWEVHGEVDRGLLTRALREVLAHSSGLLLNFRETEDGLGVLPREPGDVPLEVRDLRGEAAPEAAAHTAAAEVVGRPFDLEHDALFRFGLFTVAPSRCLLLICVHHIVIDGVGLTTLAGRIAETYTELAEGRSPQPWPDSGADLVAVHDERYRASLRYYRDAQFWRDYLAVAPDVARLPAGLGTAAVHQTARSCEPVGWSQVAEAVGVHHVAARVPASEARRWSAVAERLGVPLTTLLTAAVAVFLRHLSGSAEFLVSLVVNNRVGAARRVSGLAANFVPLRVTASDAATFAELTDAITSEKYRVLRHAQHQISDIRRGMGLPDLMRSPVGAIVNFIPDIGEIRFADAGAWLTGGCFPTLDELMISVLTTGRDGDLNIRIDAPRHAYSVAELRFFSERLLAFTRALLDDPSSRITTVDVLDADERWQVLEASNRTHAAVPRADLFALFGRRALAHPEAVAVTAGTTRLTYRELHRRAERLAGHLAGHGVRPGSTVALLLPRSIELVVAILAVVRAGAAYQPIDPRYPAQRIDLMLSGAKPDLVLADATAERAVRGEADRPVVRIDQAQETAPGALPSQGHPDQLAYIMYTSGSRGLPKGIAVTHRNVATLALDRGWRGGAHDRVLLHSPHTFDASTYELWAPLLNGGQVVVAPGGDLDPDALGDLVAGHDLTAAWLTAGLFAVIADERPESLCGLREVWAGGDVVPATAVEKIRRACPDITVVNGYGPTETTVFATCHRMPPPRPVGSSVPIGRPMDNMRAYVLGPGLVPVAAGVPGELYIAGDGLARGYVNAPVLTAERFVADPFQSGQRMYRTGDVARWNADGDLEYIGRADTQVKVRGFRIEPTEIETVLTAYPQVAQAVVVARGERGATRLVAYVVPADGDGAWPTVGELRGYLAARLPEFMVPAAVVVLPRLPLMTNGKIDRAALPEPEFVETVYRAPITEAETVLAEVIADVLGVDRVGVDDDFFTVGGDSIRSIQVVARARARGIEVGPRDIFEHRTVAALAEMAGAADVTAAPAAELGGGGLGHAPLLPAGRWLAGTGGPIGRFAMSMLLSLPPNVDEAGLVATIAALLERHDALRSRLLPEADAVEVVAPGVIAAASLVHRVPVSGDVEKPELEPLLRAQTRAAGSRLDPEAGVMAQFVWFDPDDPDDPARRGRLAVVLHHLVVDGVSWRILLPDLAMAWEQVSRGQVAVLPAVGTSARRWAFGLQHEATEPARVAEAGYWSQVVHGDDAVLGRRRFDPALDTMASVRSVPVWIPAPLSARLLATVTRRFACGPDEVLLAGFAVALARWSHNRGRPAPSLVRLEGHGRQEEAVPGADLSRTVGWFTSMFPVRVTADGVDPADALVGGPAAGRVLKQVKEQVRSVPGKGLGYGLLRYLNDRTGPRLAAAAPPQIGFNYLGRLSAAEFRQGAAGEGWTPVLGVTDLLVPPDPAMPALSALEINLMTGDGASGPEITGLMSYAEGVLGADDVSELAALWATALEGLATHAARPDAGGLTPSDVPLVSVSQPDLEGWERRFGLLSTVWPATATQSGLLFHSLLAGDGFDAYQMQLVFHLRGAVDPDRMRRAGQALLARHPNLRAAFVSGADGDLVQVIPTEAALPWSHVDLRRATGPARQARLEQSLAGDRERRFDMARPPLFRLMLVTLDDDRAELVLTAHHVLFDGWSLPLLLRDLLALYDRGGDPATLPDVPPFQRYLAWLADQDGAEAVRRWTGELTGLKQPTLLFPRGLAREAALRLERADAPLAADAEQRLKQRAAAAGVTMNTLLQGAWALVLAALTGAADVTLGATVSGRPPALAGTGDMVGLFINTLPVRVTLSPGDTVTDVLQRLQQRQAALLDHHHCGLADIQQAAGQGSLFDSLVVHESYPADAEALSAAAAAGGLALTGHEPFLDSHYPVTIVAQALPHFVITVGVRGGTQSPLSAADAASALAAVLHRIADEPSATVHRVIEEDLAGLALLLAATPPDMGGAGRPPYRAPRDEHERALCQILGEVLGTDRVGIDDDFFDLGGNSLKAIRLVGRIRAELGAEVSIRELFEAGTIASLSTVGALRTPAPRPALRRTTRDGAVLSPTTDGVATNASTAD